MHFFYNHGWLFGSVLFVAGGLLKLSLTARLGGRLTVNWHWRFIGLLWITVPDE
jgi:hypothetical protein